MKPSMRYYVLFGLIIPALSSFSSILLVTEKPNELIQRDYDYLSKVSSFTQSEFDLILNDPMDYQLDFVKSAPHVQAVQPIYRYNGSLKPFGNNDISNSFLTNAFFIENFDELEITQFNDNRLLSSLKVNPSNFIYVDRLVADALSLSLNDQIELSLTSFGISMNFVVSRIYEVDYFIRNQSRSGSVFFSFSGEYKTLITEYIGDDLLLDYFYVKTSNTEAAKNFFAANYDPEGRMLTLEWFGGNLNAYNEHVTSFRAATYPQDVVTKKAIQDLTIFDNRNALDADIVSFQIVIVDNLYLYLLSGILAIQIVSLFMLFLYKSIINKSRLFLLTSFTGSVLYMVLFSLIQYLSYSSQLVFNPLQSQAILQLSPISWLFFPIMWGTVMVFSLSIFWYFILNPKKRFQNNYRA